MPYPHAETLLWTVGLPVGTCLGHLQTLPALPLPLRSHLDEDNRCKEHAVAGPSLPPSQILGLPSFSNSSGDVLQLPLPDPSSWGSRAETGGTQEPHESCGGWSGSG